MKLAIAPVLIAIALAFTAPSAAHERTVLDSDDTSGPLDIVVGRMAHSSGSVRLRLVTYETWSKAAVSGEVDYIRFDLVRSSTPRHNRCIIVRMRGPEGEGPVHAEGKVYKDCGPFPFGSGPIGKVDTVVRPDDHSIVTTVRWSTLWRSAAAKRDAIKFRTFTSYEDEDVPGCEPPPPTQPDHFSGPCTDTTRWRTHSRA